jgi:hypothetical protein
MLPRFTLRTILAITTAMALFFVLVGAGTRGQQWALGAAIGVASIALSFALQAALFALVWCVGRLSTVGATSPSVPPASTDQEAAS